MNRKPAIISIKSTRLSNIEKSILKQHNPWGVILFQRNINSYDQVKILTHELRKIMNDPFYPILVDEEGGKVSRFSNLLNSREFSQKFFGDLYEKNNKTGKNLYKYYLNSICSVLKDVGININTIPVLDLLQNSTHEVIGSRSYSNNLRTIKKLGDICIKTLKQNKIGSVIKHIPGHGCANADSHKKLPKVTKSLEKLISNDFKLFKNSQSDFAMTAHVLYKSVDPNFAATHSNKVIFNIIRKKLKYRGLIISDDISMKSLSKNLVYNAKTALKSGCNLVLHCNGNINETSLLLKNLNNFDAFTEKKTRHFYQFLR